MGKYLKTNSPGTGKSIANFGNTNITGLTLHQSDLCPVFTTANYNDSSNIRLVTPQSMPVHL